MERQSSRRRKRSDMASSKDEKPSASSMDNGKTAQESEEETKSNPESSPQAQAQAQAQFRSRNRLLLLSLLPFLAIFSFFGLVYYYSGIGDDHPLGRWSSTKHHANDISPSKGFSDTSALSANWFLHPQDHVYREATTHQLDWRITAGYRRPDGVRKRVYLINGG
jgi:hypothetical protein